MDDYLPDAILRPWCQVNERLGRGPRPYQNVYDLFLNNFRLRSDGTTCTEYLSATCELKTWTFSSPVSITSRSVFSTCLS